MKAGKRSPTKTGRLFHNLGNPLVTCSMPHDSNVERASWKRWGTHGKVAEQSQRRGGPEDAGTWPGAVFNFARRRPGGREDVPELLPQAADRVRPAACQATLAAEWERAWPAPPGQKDRQWKGFVQFLSV